MDSYVRDHVILPLGFTLVVVSIWLFFRLRRGSISPMAFERDDPEMKAARAEAQRTMPEFLDLYSKYPTGAAVKVPFVTSTETREDLAAEILWLREGQVHVRLLTPPVTHQGKMERELTYSLTELADWVILMPNGKYEGGFTMKLMFRKAREQWGHLPPELAEEERKYQL